MKSALTCYRYQFSEQGSCTTVGDSRQLRPSPAFPGKASGVTVAPEPDSRRMVPAAVLPAE